MVGNDVVIPQPDPAPSPAPEPSPTPTPAPKVSLTPADLKTDLDAFSKFLHGIDALLPTTARTTVDKVLGVLDVGIQQPWFLDMVCSIFNHFAATGKKPTSDELRKAVYGAILQQGEAKIAKAKV